MLVGRRFDVAALQELLADVAAGRGRALAFVGRAGVGKSALLAGIPEWAPEAEVRPVTGVEAEAELAWTGLAGLLDGLVDEEVLAGLAPPRAAALRQVLLLSDDPSPVDLRAVAVATLDVATRRATVDRPLVIVVDDLHWLDEESRRAIGFVARRIGQDPVGVVVASRGSTELPQRTLVDLDGPAADDLLRAEGVTDGEVRTRLLTDLGTNPMLLVEAARGLTSEARTGTVPLPDVLPLPASLAANARQRLGSLGPEARQALLTLACLASSDRSTVAAALQARGSSLDDLVPAAEHGVVDLAGPVTFTHPTLRAAVVASASPDDRRQVHGALAAVADDPVSRAVHGALAADGPDEAVAVDLEHAARRLARTGALATAAAELGRAAGLSEDPVAAARRRALGAEARLALGDIGSARRLLDEARNDLSGAAPGRLGESTGALVDRLTARALHLEGRNAEAVTVLRGVAGTIAAVDPGGAADALLEALVPLVRRIDVAGVGEVAAELRALAPRCPPDLVARIDVVDAALAALVSGDGAMALERARRLFDAEGAVGAGPLLGGVVGPILSYRERGGALLALLRDLERDLREAAALVPLAWVLGSVPVHHHGRDQAAAIVAGAEAIDLAEELGLPGTVMTAAQGLAIAAAMAGARAALDRAQAVLGRSAEPADWVVARTAEGAYALGTGDLDVALAAYEEVRDQVGIGSHLVRWEPEYAETLIRLRRPDEAHALLVDLGSRGLVAPSAGRFARVEGLLAEEEDGAGERFATSVAALLAAGDAVNAGRSELCWGERARRARRRGEARQHLEVAHRLLAGAGAEPWARRARVELEAAGGAVADGSAPSHSLLTTQELRIARLAAAGASNRKIGASVFLSERTVETHLSSVYRKLQVRGRRGLAARAVHDPTLRDPSA